MNRDSPNTRQAYEIQSKLLQMLLVLTGCILLNQLIGISKSLISPPFELSWSWVVLMMSLQLAVILVVGVALHKLYYFDLTARRFFLVVAVLQLIPALLTFLYAIGNPSYFWDFFSLETLPIQLVQGTVTLMLIVYLFRPQVRTCFTNLPRTFGHKVALIILSIYAPLSVVPGLYAHSRSYKSVEGEKYYTEFGMNKSVKPIIHFQCRLTVRDRLGVDDSETLNSYCNCLTSDLIKNCQQTNSEDFGLQCTRDLITRNAQNG